MTASPTVIHCHIEDGPEPVTFSPDEWVRDAGRYLADGVRRVVLDAIPDGSPWTDDPAVFDLAADTWVFAPWPGVAFELPLEE